MTGGGLSHSIPVTVNLTNVNEAPAFATDVATTLAVPENSPAGTTVGSFPATDPDNDTADLYIVRYGRGVVCSLTARRGSLPP